MITVSITINGAVLFARSARNMKEEDDCGATKYLLDTGEVIWHVRENGAVDLAQRMLGTINAAFEND